MTDKLQGEIENDENFKFLDDKIFKEFNASLTHLILTDKVKIRIKKGIETKMISNDKISLVLAMVGMITNIIQSVLFLTFDKVQDSSSTASIIISTSPSEIITFLRFICLFSTLALIYLIYLHYLYYLRLLKIKDIINASSTIYSSNLVWYMILEMMICSIHTHPFFYYSITISYLNNDVPVNIDLITTSIIPFRIYLFIKYFSYYSNWANDKAEKICNNYNIKGGISFAIKAELKEQPFKIVGSIMIVSILIFGFALRNTEAAFMLKSSSFLDWRYVWNGFWCIVITLLTVGFGDLYPQTLLGRFIVVIACLWGTFLISLMVVSLTNSVQFDCYEERAYTEIKNIERNDNLKKLAIDLIRYSVKLKNFPENKEEIKGNEIRKQYIYLIDSFKNSLDKFRTSRKFKEWYEEEISAEQIMRKLNENLSEKMSELLVISSDEIDSMGYLLGCIKDIHDEIKTNTRKLETMTMGLYQKVIIE